MSGMWARSVGTLSRVSLRASPAAPRARAHLLTGCAGFEHPIVEEGAGTPDTDMRGLLDRCAAVGRSPRTTFADNDARGATVMCRDHVFATVRESVGWGEGAVV